MFISFGCLEDKKTIIGFDGKTELLYIKEKEMPDSLSVVSTMLVIKPSK